MLSAFSFRLPFQRSSLEWWFLLMRTPSSNCVVTDRTWLLAALFGMLNAELCAQTCVMLLYWREQNSG